VRVLAVDTTSPRGSLALADGGRIVGERRVASETGHSTWLLSAVDELVREAAVQATEVDLFATTSGPGSFTGVRVGLASIQGLALAAGRRCLGIPTLDVWARQALGTAPAIVVLLDAFRGELFWAVYDGHGGLAGERRVGTLDDALGAAPAGSAYVGDAVEARVDAIRARAAGASFPPASGYLAATLALMAGERASQAVAPRELRPVYLRAAAIRPSRT
jgi:tRNA threonylcarbamoyladenosine biosynthesis protein TsaB